MNQWQISSLSDYEFVDQATEQLFDLLITNRILVDVPQLLGW